MTDLANKTEEQPRIQQEKTPATRLLDLIAGWSHFVQQDEMDPPECEPEEEEEEQSYVDPVQYPIIDPLLRGDELAGFYQDVAAEIIPLEGEAENEAVRRIVLERILPMLLRR